MVPQDALRASDRRGDDMRAHGLLIVSRLVGTRFVGLLIVAFLLGAAVQRHMDVRSLSSCVDGLDAAQDVLTQHLAERHPKR